MRKSYSPLGQIVVSALEGFCLSKLKARYLRRVVRFHKQSVPKIKFGLEKVLGLRA
jgi:hypothetical protein